MKRKWYLQTWFICLMFSLWVLIIPIAVGIVLLILQALENRELGKKYGRIDNLNQQIWHLENEQTNANNRLSNLVSGLNNKIQQKENEIAKLKNEISDLEHATLCKHYIFSDYDGLTSEDCKNRYCDVLMPNVIML